MPNIPTDDLAETMSERLHDRLRPSQRARWESIWRETFPKHGLDFSNWRKTIIDTYCSGVVANMKKES